MGAGSVIFPDPLGASIILSYEVKCPVSLKYQPSLRPPSSPKRVARRERSPVCQSLWHQRQDIKELTFSKRWYLSSLSSNVFKG